MRSVFVHGERSSEDLGGLLTAVGAEAQGAAAYAFGEARVVRFVGRKFMFRSNDHLGVVVLGASNGTSQRIDLSYAGAGSGVFGMQWGADETIVTTVFRALVQMLGARSLPYQETGPAPG